LDAVSGVPASEPASGFLVRLAVAAMLGGLLGVTHGRMAGNAQASRCGRRQSPMGMRATGEGQK